MGGSREKRERREARTRYSSAMARVAITRAKAPRMTSRTQMNRATVKVAGGVIAAAAARNVVCRAASTDVLDKVRGIISEQLGADLDKVGADAKFVDLGADSLDTVEIMMALEEQFDITLDEEGAEKISTVQEAADLIADQVAAK